MVIDLIVLFHYSNRLKTNILCFFSLDLQATISIIMITSLVMISIAIIQLTIEFTLEKCFVCNIYPSIRCHIDVIVMVLNREKKHGYCKQSAITNECLSVCSLIESVNGCIVQQSESQLETVYMIELNKNTMIR
jgi:hypothetical protein